MGVGGWKLREEDRVAAVGWIAPEPVGRNGGSTKFDGTPRPAGRGGAMTLTGREGGAHWCGAVATAVGGAPSDVVHGGPHRWGWRRERIGRDGGRATVPLAEVPEEP